MLATRIWRSALRRTAGLWTTIMFFAYLYYHWGFRSAGPLAGVTSGILLQIMWPLGRTLLLPKWAATGGCATYHVRAAARSTRLAHLRVVPPHSRDASCTLCSAQLEVEHHVGQIWKWVIQPLLFVVVGTTVDFRALKGTLVNKAMTIIFVGSAVRYIIVVLVTWGAGWSLRERLFVGIAWSPKATVQAALGGVPLEAIHSAFAPIAATDPATYAEARDQEPPALDGC